MAGGVLGRGVGVVVSFNNNTSTIVYKSKLSIKILPTLLIFACLLPPDMNVQVIRLATVASKTSNLDSPPPFPSTHNPLSDPTQI